MTASVTKKPSARGRRRSPRGPVVRYKFADGTVEELPAIEVAAELFDQQRRLIRAMREDAAAPRRTGGKTQAEENKAAAAEWQKKITPEVRRLLDARMSAENIGKRLSARAGRSADRVARFARSLKKKSGK